ncbi:MAG TPA: alpha/beta fold hydrolase [Methylomirabilota bacterium]|nr:alpha/beta fold hydrolase [Methylomirabilota bacterium]
MPRVTVNGIGLFYQDLGAPDAEPVVLIMGWGGDHTAWAFQMPALAAAYRVIAPDNRGAGQTDQPDAPYSIAGMADDVAALLDRLGVTRAHVCGASMGGMIAQELALRHPGRVRTLQLHCTLARPDAYGTHLVETLLRVRAREDREEWARAMLPWIISRKTARERPDFVQLMIQRALDNPYPTSLAGLRRQAEAIGGHDTLERLGSIRVPTLITVGSDDILVPPSFSREILARISGADFALIPDAGHVHFLEQPQAFNEAMVRFLSKHATGAGVRPPR